MTSGRGTSAAKKAAARAAGRARQYGSRKGPGRPTTAPKSPLGVPGPPPAPETAAERPESAPAKAARDYATVAEYDLVVGPPLSWPDAKAREGVRGEILAVEKARLELEERRGALIPRAKRDAQLQAQAAALIEALTALAPDAFADLVEPHRAADARKAALGFVAAVRSAVAKSLTASR